MLSTLLALFLAQNPGPSLTGATAGSTGGGGITFVQVALPNSAIAFRTTSATYTAGDYNICVTVGSSATASVTDQAIPSNTYTGLGDQDATTPGEHLQVWTAPITNGFTGYVTDASANAGVGITCYEVSKSGGAPVSDVYALSQANFVGTITSSAFTTAHANEFSAVWAGAASAACTGFTTTSSGYTVNGTNTAGFQTTAMYNTLASIVTGVTVNLTCTGSSAQWGTLVSTFY